MSKKLSLISLLFLLASLFDYKKCRTYDDYCYNYPYSFYMIMKFIICSYFIYKVYVGFKKSDNSYRMIFSGIFAFVYNPIIAVPIEKTSWYNINLCTICFILLTSNWIKLFFIQKETFRIKEKDISNKYINYSALERLSELKEKNFLSSYEFDLMKTKLLKEGTNNIIKNDNKGKSLWRYFFECITSKYFCFKGRARRKEYWGFIIFGSIFYSILFILEPIFFLKFGYSYQKFLWFLSLSPSVGVSVRRLHDVGLSAYWIIIPQLAMLVINNLIVKDNADVIISGWYILISLFCLGICCILAFVKSNLFENKYGSIPKGVIK